MKQDIRDSRNFIEAERLYRAWRRPGSGRISGAADVHVKHDGTSAVFTGAIIDDLEGVPATHICKIDLDSGKTSALTTSGRANRLPKYSPDGSRIAFLGERENEGDFQLSLIDAGSGTVTPAPKVNGWVEYLHWSPDGTTVLLAVAGHGADVAGGQGAVTSKREKAWVPDWLPLVESADDAHLWRSIWTYDVGRQSVQQVRIAGRNVWEAAWCGNDGIVAVVSPGPSEGHWYGARLAYIDLASGVSEDIFTPRDQIGMPASTASGSRVAVVEAVCSDRWFVAGELRLVDVRSKEVARVETAGVDVCYTEWRNENALLVAGHRGCETVIGVYDVEQQVFRETWASSEISTGGFFATIAGTGQAGDCVLVGEGFSRAPEIARIRSGIYQVIHSFDIGYGEEAKRIAGVERLSWASSDGTEIQGWLLTPAGEGPFPTVMNVHGGPVWHWRPMCLARNLPMLMLVQRGYAVFLPNPRGSTGRGQEFVRHVVGDMGGADMQDCLTGLDHLVARGLADPVRIGVTGGSYGGFMTSWLIAQDDRFAAAVPVAPVTNHVSAHLVSNIPSFIAMFLQDSYTNCAGKYFQRSPVMHAGNVKTPTLNICGALDRCTPPEEARQFHNALLENGVESVLVTYPEEGHGIRRFPAAIDYTARVVAWFEEHMPVHMPLDEAGDCPGTFRSPTGP